MVGPRQAFRRRYVRAARIVTATERGAIEDAAGAVEGSRIVAVGPATQLTPHVPATATAWGSPSKPA